MMRTKKTLPMLRLRRYCWKSKITPFLGLRLHKGHAFILDYFRSTIEKTSGHKNHKILDLEVGTQTYNLDVPRSIPSQRSHQGRL